MKQPASTCLGPANVYKSQNMNYLYLIASERNYTGPRIFLVQINFSNLIWEKLISVNSTWRCETWLHLLDLTRVVIFIQTIPFLVVVVSVCHNYGHHSLIVTMATTKIVFWEFEITKALGTLWSNTLRVKRANKHPSKNISQNLWCVEYYYPSTLIHFVCHGFKIGHWQIL